MQKYANIPNALNKWLLLERPLTSLPDLQAMKQDLKLPIDISLHGRKTAGHMNKARFLTINSLEVEGQDSLLLLAKAANVWGKLVAGFVIKPRYLTTNSQEIFWEQIMARPTDIPIDQQATANSSLNQFSGTNEEFTELFDNADASTTNAMQILHETAVSNNDFVSIMPVFKDSQYHLYKLALACISTQLDRTDVNIDLAGIMEPGRDAESDRIMTISELSTI